MHFQHRSGRTVYYIRYGSGMRIPSGRHGTSGSRYCFLLLEKLFFRIRDTFFFPG